MDDKNVDILIVGGGIIGVCCAYYLAAQGRSVTILDKGEIGAGCSYGNAGLVAPGHAIPLAAPGVLQKGFKWLFDADSPFYIKPRLDRDLLSWLWQFRAACTSKQLSNSIPLLRDLGLASATLYQSLVAEERVDCYYEQRGLISVFDTEQRRVEEEAEVQLLQAHGVAVELLSAAAVRERVPQLRPSILGGLYFPHDAHLDPFKLVSGLAVRLQERGVVLERGVELLGFETGAGRIESVYTTHGNFRPQEVILAAGAWSPVAARSLGIKIPIQAAKGYSITLARPPAVPDMPLILGETMVAVTPMGDRWRVAGTLELAGLDLTINQRRVAAVKAAATRYLSQIEETPLVEIWRGLRPVTPDGLPIIGRTQRWPNLIIAAGHAMLGLSLGPVTGQLVAQLVRGETPNYRMDLLGLARFGGIVEER